MDVIAAKSAATPLPASHTEQYLTFQLAVPGGARPLLRGRAVVGGHTGLRVGIQAAKSLAQVLGIPILGLASLDLLGKIGPKYNAVAALTTERALDEAKRADTALAKKQGGPLTGIPYGAKDLLAARGAPTTWGAPPYRDQIIGEDATVGGGGGLGAVVGEDVGQHLHGCRLPDVIKQTRYENGDEGDQEIGAKEIGLQGVGEPIDAAHLSDVLESLAQAQRRRFATDAEVEAKLQATEGQIADLQGQPGHLRRIGHRAGRTTSACGETQYAVHRGPAKALESPSGPADAAPARRRGQRP